MLRNSVNEVDTYVHRYISGYDLNSLYASQSCVVMGRSVSRWVRMVVVFIASLIMKIDEIRRTIELIRTCSKL